jgi:hypothetical protein
MRIFSACPLSRACPSTAYAPFVLCTLLPPNTLYIAHELASSFTAQPLPTAPNGTSAFTAQLSTIPPNNQTAPFWAAAEILIPDPTACFPASYAYVSNRNTDVTVDARGDMFAIFALQPEMRLVGQVYKGAQQVRGVQFGDADSECLVLSGVVARAGSRCSSARRVARAWSSSCPILRSGTGRALCGTRGSTCRCPSGKKELCFFFFFTLGLCLLNVRVGISFGCALCQWAAVSRRMEWIRQLDMRARTAGAGLRGPVCFGAASAEACTRRTRCGIHGSHVPIANH